ncbi:unnamed protein product [Ilex paraguariensis]|uniref:Uncharacterized protein n=1 Tax=Ilex paraguariensis TaxID=185542 RepID=A0ABC8SPG1_9AQUA
MRPSLLVSLLLLSSLLHEAQGIRLEKGSLAAGQQQMIHEVGLTTKIKGVVEEVDLCKDGHCSGMIRKLMSKTTSISSTTTNSKNHKKEGKEENLSINSSPVSERYPDTLDIAGMDYSPARRKPPIHN